MKSADKIAKTAFILYAVLMIWLLFGQRIGNGTVDSYWDELSQNINLVPFETVGRYVDMLKNSENGRLSHHAIINLVGNIVMFIPLGLLLPFAVEKAASLKKCLALSLAVLLCVEILQLFTLLGSFDIDDIIFNMAGVFIGYIMYREYIKRRPLV